MVDGSAVSPVASFMELFMQLHGGNCVDSFKAVVLVLPQWWEDLLREVYWFWKGVGITLGSKLVLEGCGVTLDSRLVLEGCEHLIGYSSEAGISWWAPGSANLESITELGGHVWRHTQAWKGQGTLVWVDSAWVQTIAGVRLGLVFGVVT